MSHEDQLHDEDKHDILIIPRNGVLYRVPCQGDGGFSESVGATFTPDQAGARRSMNIVRPAGETAPGPAWGPAFATVPKKPEPPTAQVCCYVVNTEHVRASNPWTHAAWNAEPQDENRDLKAPVAELSETLEFMVAGSLGDVYRVALDQRQLTAQVSALELKREAAVYTSLRNGLVAGSAPCVGAYGEILPLINLTALATPAQPVRGQTNAGLADEQPQ